MCVLMSVCVYQWVMTRFAGVYVWPKLYTPAYTHSCSQTNGNSPNPGRATCIHHGGGPVFWWFTAYQAALLSGRRLAMAAPSPQHVPLLIRCNISLHYWEPGTSVLSMCACVRQGECACSCVCVCVGACVGECKCLYVCLWRESYRPQLCSFGSAGRPFTQSGFSSKQLRTSAALKYSNPASTFRQPLLPQTALGSHPRSQTAHTHTHKHTHTLQYD